MNILGPDSLVFGVDDLPLCRQQLLDYGLKAVEASDSGGRFEALDGTSIALRLASDRSLPSRLPTASLLRETVYGVADGATLEAIGAELSKDRDVRRGADGSLQCRDDSGFALRFQLSVRRRLTLEPELVNAPGAQALRSVNRIGVDLGAEIRPRTLSHVVYFVPDAARAEAFYARLGFRTTDRFIGVGPFMRPAGTLDHHTLFLIQTPPLMQGVEHFTFHLGGPTEVLLAGTRYAAKGHQSFWGPGRHVLGSNWFWYFNSPLGCHIEYDADMDLHDDQWTARSMPMRADNTQIFLFQQRDKWVPGPPAK